MDKEFIKEYFGKHWTSRTSEYRYSNHSIADKIKPNERVIDIGCGNNEFKKLIPNLLGIDIVNPAADLIVDFDEFKPAGLFDVALCLGSIQYGNRADIERQLAKLSSILTSTGRVYWRTNTGVRDHKNELVKLVPYYPWTEQAHHEFAEQFGFTCDFVTEDLHGRLYAEWSKKMNNEKTSSWDRTRAASTYHFDPRRVDQPADVVRLLGHVEPTWYGDLNDIIARSKPANWETRGYKGEGVPPPREDLIAEEYDLERVGADPKMTITHLNWDLPPSLQAVSDAFALDDCMNRIHVQMPGEVWNLHIDKLGKWCPEDPSRVMRVFIQLTDWQPGQFWEYGNYHWNQWTAGDVSTFDWPNMPHSTANAGHHPRVTLQITGVITEQTKQYLKCLKES